jgi:hypothetical protein
MTAASTQVAVVNNGSIVEVRRADGSLAERYLGDSAEQIKFEHDAGRCGALCSHCYQEAMEWLASQPAPTPHEMLDTPQTTT